MESVRESSRRLADIQMRVSKACRRAGRSPQKVQIVAVSKRHSVESVLQLGACGQRVFAENQIQEAARKIPRVAEQWEGEPPRWRLVGHLQRNKVKQAVELFQSIDSVDSFRLLDALQREGERVGRKISVLLQFNCSQESQKSGFPLSDVEAVSLRVPGYDHIQVKGLMTIAHLALDFQDARKDFASLREVKDDLEQVWGEPLGEISMGMSHDFEVAIEEGATLIRVGTALFGPRKN